MIFAAILLHRLHDRLYIHPTPPRLDLTVAMLINCFRPAAKSALGEHDDPHPQPARPRPNPRKTATFLRRSGTDNSRVSSTSSTTSNDSISKLPPCKRRSDAEIDALMMPVPHNERPSRCLRLSHPRVYSSLVAEMKASRGCRNWKDFDVFYADDVDMRVSAVDKARKTAEMHARKMRGFDSFDSETRRSIDEVDLIG